MKTKKNSIYSSMPAGVLEKLSGKKVLICGAGGLGSNVAMLLTRAGVGNIDVFDYDIVSSSNLNRQFFFQHQVGDKKINALSDNLRLINPCLNLKTKDLKLSKENIKNILSDKYDLVLECFDDAEAKALLVNYMLINFPQTPLVAASGVCGVGESETMPIRWITECFAIVGDQISEIDQGTLSSRVMQAAATEAQVGIMMLLR